MKEKKYFMIMYLFKNGLKDFQDHYIRFKKNRLQYGFPYVKRSRLKIQNHWCKLECNPIIFIEFLVEKPPKISHFPPCLKQPLTFKSLEMITVPDRLGSRAGRKSDFTRRNSNKPNVSVWHRKVLVDFNQYLKVYPWSSRQIFT